MKRVAELDSLRALAAIVVLFFHLDPFRYVPGWSGVDLFFVLSGYLITSIIIRNGETRGFYRNFYARRTLRIWPTYYLTVLVLVAVNPFLPRPGSFADLPYVLTYTQYTPIYWGKEPPPNYPALNHTWTLAIEEQFYLIWPALVLWVGRKRLVPLCLMTIGLAMAARDGGNFLIPKYPQLVLVSRCDGFAIGGLLACSFEEGGWAWRRQRLAGYVFGAAVGSALIYLIWGSRTFGALHFIGLPTPMYPAEVIFAFGALRGDHRPGRAERRRPMALAPAASLAGLSRSDQLWIVPVSLCGLLGR